MLQYLSYSKNYGVLYHSWDGTYSVVRVHGGEGPATWTTVLGERDFFKDARELCDEFDRNVRVTS